MNNITKILPILFLLAFTGCEDVLEEKVYSDLLVESYQYDADDIYSVIGPVYQNLRHLAWHENFYGLQWTTTDAFCIPANTSGWDDGGIWKKLHLHSWTSEHNFINNMWLRLYKGVIHANRVIDQLETKSVPLPDGESYDALIAEMKAARAFYYWLLIDNFGDVPYFTSATTSDLPGNTARATVYNAIVADVEAGLSVLSEENNVKMYGRFNKWGAKTLLAYLYLNAEVYTGTAAWDKCLSECNDVINSGKYSLEANYTDCFSPNNENSKETILAIPFDEIYTNNWSNPLIWHLFVLHVSSQKKYNITQSTWGAGGLKAIPQFINTYNSLDSRLKDTYEQGPQFAADGVTPLLCDWEKKGQQLDYTNELPDGIYCGENEGYRMLKFKPQWGANITLTNDVPFFRYGMVKMMKAECLLRTGQADAAATVVTEVRQRAFKANPDQATVTGAQLTANSKYNWGYVENYVITDQGDQAPVEYGGMYDELGYEFAGEWTRRQEMVRFGTYTTKSWLSHKPNGTYRSLFPIPQPALDANANLVQNTNY